MQATSRYVQQERAQPSQVGKSKYLPRRNFGELLVRKNQFFQAMPNSTSVSLEGAQDSQHNAQVSYFFMDYL